MYPPIALKVLKEARNEHEPFCSRFRWRLAAGCTWSARERHRERSTRLGGSGRQSVFLETGKPRGFTFRGRYSSPQRPQRVGMEGAGLGWGLIETRSGSHRRPLWCRAVVAIRVRPVHRVLVLPHTLASLCSSVRRCEINATVSRNHPRCRRALPSCSGGMTGRTRCWNALPPHVSHECVVSTPLLSQTCANT